MHFSKVGILLLIIILSVLLSGCSKPLFVTHWSQKDAFLVKKKGWGWPSHKWYSRVICFDEKCRKKSVWVRNQRNDRFKGFKDGGKLPPPPVRPREIAPRDTALIARSTQPIPVGVGEQKEEVTNPIIKPDSLIVLNEVLFAINSFRLRPELFPQLDSIVSFLGSNPQLRIEISGHTDNTGKEAHNLRLSENRADAVAEYLVDRGVEAGRVSFNGFGSSRPVAGNDTAEGRGKNRRVEILIHNRP